VRGNPQAQFGKRPTEKDLAKGTSPAVDFTWREVRGNSPGAIPIERPGPTRQQRSASTRCGSRGARGDKERLCRMRAAVEGYEAEAARLSWVRALTGQAARRSAVTRTILLIATLLCIGLLGLPFIQFRFSGPVNSLIDREISAIGLALTGATLALAPLIRRGGPEWCSVVRAAVRGVRGRG
jgi:hypothetical protein